MNAWTARLLSERTRLLLLSLAIAIALWFYVGSTVRSPGEGAPIASLRMNNVEVMFTNVADGLIATSTPDVVDIEMRWPAASVLSVRPRDVQAVADLSALQPGRHSVTLRIQVPAGVTAVRATPPSVVVTLTPP